MSVFLWIGKWLRRSLTRQQNREQSALSGLPQEQHGTTDEDKRLQWFKHQLTHCSDIAFHEFAAGRNIPCTLIYLKGMTDQKMIQQAVLAPILSLPPTVDEQSLAAILFDRRHLPIDDTMITRSMREALDGILSGQVLLVAGGNERMLAMALASFEKRSIEEAPTESVIRGPRDAFIENFEVNISLIRRRLRTESFKTEVVKIGTETRTPVVIAYLQGICRQELVDEARKRLLSIDIDGVLASGYLEEFIEDNPYSPFPQLQYTERPDVVTAALLEGRVAIFADGSPVAIIAPATFYMFMQAADDYYQRYTAASWIRWIRYVFLFASLLLPSLYIAITTLHAEVIPEKLLRTLAAAREIVPFPALVEAFVMEIFFEALREAAVRIPKSVGQAVSIIGALIIGTAAVDAGIVSAAMVIIVSLTGISSFIIPHYDLGLAFRLLRFPMMILAGTFGLYGIACGMILIYLHLIELRSFGVPYLSPIVPMKFGELKDVLIRAPWWAMNRRPSFAGSNRQRQSRVARKWAPPPEEGD